MQDFINATPDCPNVSAVLPSFGHARVTCLPRHAAVTECQRDVGTGQAVPMASTLSSTQADPRFDSGAAPTMAKDCFTSVEEALAGLEEALASFVHQAVNDTPVARPRGPASDRSADASISQSFAAARLGVADLGPRVPREQRSQGKRRTLARLAIAVCLGGSAIWA